MWKWGSEQHFVPSLPRDPRDPWDRRDPRANSGRLDFADIYNEFGTMSSAESEVQLFENPANAPGEPKAVQRDPTGAPRRTKEGQRNPKGRPKGAQGTPKGSQRGTPREPKVDPKAAKGAFSGFVKNWSHFQTVWAVSAQPPGIGYMIPGILGIPRK